MACHWLPLCLMSEIDTISHVLKGTMKEYRLLNEDPYKKNLIKGKDPRKERYLVAA